MPFSTRKSAYARKTFKKLFVAALLMSAFPGVASAQVQKANNANALNLTSSWTGGVVPGATDIISWGSTVTAANAPTLGGNLSVQGIQIVNPGGAVTIAATTGATLTIGSSGIDLSTATQNLTIAALLSLGANQTWNTQTGRTLTVSGITSGSGALTKAGAGQLTLSGVNTFTGPILINAGTVSVGTIGDGGVAGNLGAATNDAGNLILGGGTLSYTGATASTNRNFTLTNGTTSSIAVTTSGSVLTITGAAVLSTGGLTKTSLGGLVLQGTNLYSGVTTVSQGALTLSGLNGSIASSSSLTLSVGSTLTFANTNTTNNTNRISDTAAINASGATLNFTNNAGAVNYTETMGAFNSIAGTNVINAGTAAAVGQTNALTFASLSMTGGSAINFSGTNLGTAATGASQIFFTTGPTLTNGLISTRALYNNAGFASYGGNGVINASYVDIAATGATIVDGSATNVRINSGVAGTNTLGVAVPTTSINTLTHATTVTSTVDTLGQNLRVNAILSGNTGGLTIGATANSGTLSTVTGTQLDLINTSSGTQTINSTVVDNAASTDLVKRGTGVVTLLGTNTYTGQTLIQEGTLRIRQSVASGVAGPLGNSAGAIVVGNANSASGTANNPGIILQVQPVGDSDSLTIGRDIDFNQTPTNNPGRSRLAVLGNFAGGADTQTVTVSGAITLAGRGGTEFTTDRAGQVLNITGQVLTGGNGTIFLTGTSGAPASSTTDGASTGTVRFSNLSRSFTNGINVTSGAILIDGVVGATGTNSPVGTANFSLADGNGGSMFAANGQSANRTILLDSAGSSYARTLSPSTGTGNGQVTGPIYGTNATAGSSGNLNMINSYVFGGNNTTGTVTFSGAISPSGIAVPVTGTAAGSGGTNPIVNVYNLALIAQTGGTVEFSGAISGNVNPTLGSTTTSGALGAATSNSTRITINQVRNHQNLDVTRDGTPDAAGTDTAGRAIGANQLVGTATNGRIVLSRANTFNGGVEVLGGTLQLGNGGTAGSLNNAASNAIVLTGGALEFRRSDAITQGTTFTTTAISGAGSVIQGGTGNTTLNVANNYSGGTTVNAGVLTLANNSAAGSGAVTINNGGRVNVAAATTINNSVNLLAGGIAGGTGTFTTLDISNGGILAPGFSPGAINVTNANFGANGVYQFEINDFAGAAGTNWDLLNATNLTFNTLTSTNPFEIRLISLNGAVAGNAANFNGTIDSTNTLRIGTVANGIPGSFASNLFTVNTTGFSNSFSGAFSVGNVGNDLFLNYITAVPEPTTLTLVGLFGGVLALRRFRRKSVPS